MKNIEIIESCLPYKLKFERSNFIKNIQNGLDTIIENGEGFAPLKIWDIDDSNRFEWNIETIQQELNQFPQTMQYLQNWKEANDWEQSDLEFELIDCHNRLYLEVYNDVLCEICEKMGLK